MLKCVIWGCLLGVYGCLVDAGIMMSPMRQSNPDTIIQEECNVKCGGARVPGESVCYIAHPTDCFKFVICTPVPLQMSMHTQIMPCAFGTMWKAGTESACERADLVQCINDPCLQPNTTVYNDPDSNCRTHYTCEHGRSVPSCCGRYQRFDPLTEKCVNDYNCGDSCPLLNDATCQGRGVTSLNIADGNCKTYWECRDGRPYTMCCPDGMGYDVFASACMPNATCTDVCPQGNQNQCNSTNVQGYVLTDNPNCRTYMKCSTKVPGQADPFCCRSGMMFDEGLQTCVGAKTKACINAQCPMGYSEECGLEAIPGNPRVYKNLDAFGGQNMPCPVGTVFIQDKCHCGPDPTRVHILPGPGQCLVAVHAIMPDLKNMGSAVAALLMIGKYGQGESGVGNMTTFWDGDDGINIPYFGSQDPSKLYIEISLKPAPVPSLKPAPVPQGPTFIKQVLISSCKNIGDLPSLEVSLMSYHNGTGVLHTLVTTPGLRLGTFLRISYSENQDYKYKLIYDGAILAVVLTPINQGAVGPVVRTERFSGNIPIHRSGLRLAKCRYDHEQYVSGFVGYISEIKISKCLTPAMEQELDSLMGVP